MLVILDVDNTLVDRDSAMRRWGRLLLERESLPLSLLNVVLEADAGGVTHRDIFLERIRRVFTIAESPEEFHNWYKESYVSCFQYEPDSAAALRKFRAAGWVIAVASNGPAKRQAMKLENAGLIHLVDAICTSDEVGVEKPDPQVFLESARRAGCRLDGWVIGDDPIADIWGGQQSGMHTAWVSHGRKWDDTASHPDIIAESLSGAVDEILSN